MLDYNKLDTTDAPFFSIITPAYNCESFVLDAIISVENQIFEDWEMIIVEDNSTDNTFKVVEDYIKENDKIRLVKTSTNFGAPGGPRDLGVQLSKGKYIAFLDADDMYHTEKFQRHFDSIKKNPSIEFIHTSHNIVLENKQFVVHQKLKWFLKVYMRLFSMKTVCLLTNPFNVNTTVIKKELIIQYNFKTFPKLLSAVEDWFLWNRILRDGRPIIHYDELPLTDYRWVKNSISGRVFNRGELQSIIFFSILLYEKKINPFEWIVSTYLRLIRIFFTSFLGYYKDY